MTKPVSREVGSHVSCAATYCKQRRRLCFVKVRVTSRELSELPPLRCLAYDNSFSRLAAVCEERHVAVCDRTGGEDVWRCGSSWQAGCSRVTQVRRAHVVRECSCPVAAATQYFQAPRTACQAASKAGPWTVRCPTRWPKSA